MAHSSCFCSSSPLAAVPDAPQGQQAQTLPPIEVYFSPNGGCTEAVVKEIAAAKTTILVQAYSFTSAPIAKALVDAHKRGVQIQVILDKSQRSEKYSSADFVLHAGIPTFIDAKHAIAHNKIMVIDGATVITGSFNFTKAAETSNAENLLVIRPRNWRPSTPRTGRPIWSIRRNTKRRKRATRKRTGPRRSSHRRPTPLCLSPVDSWHRLGHRSSTGPIANQRRRFRQRTSSITILGMRRSRPERSRVRSVGRDSPL